LSLLKLQVEKSANKMALVRRCFRCALPVDAQFRRLAETPRQADNQCHFDQHRLHVPRHSTLFHSLTLQASVTVEVGLIKIRKTVLDLGSRSERPRYGVTTTKRAGLRRCRWLRQRHAARFAALAHSWWRDNTRSSAIAETPARRSISVEMLFYGSTPHSTEPRRKKEPNSDVRDIDVNWTVTVIIRFRLVLKWTRWNFAKIFGIWKLVSMRYRMALFAWSYI